MPVDPVDSAIASYAMQYALKFYNGEYAMDKGPAAKNAARQEEQDKAEQADREDNQDPDIEPEEPPPKSKFMPQGGIA